MYSVGDYGTATWLHRHDLRKLHTHTSCANSIMHKHRWHQMSMFQKLLYVGSSLKDVAWQQTWQTYIIVIYLLQVPLGLQYDKMMPTVHFPSTRELSQTNESERAEVVHLNRLVFGDQLTFEDSKWRQGGQHIQSKCYLQPEVRPTRITAKAETGHNCANVNQLGHRQQYLTVLSLVTLCTIPYSGKFSLVQIFAKIPFPFQKKFSRF